MDFAEVQSYLCCNTTEALENRFKDVDFQAARIVAGPLEHPDREGVKGTVVFAGEGVDEAALAASGALVCKVKGTLSGLPAAVELADGQAWLAAFSRLAEAFRDLAQRKERLLGLMDGFDGPADLSSIVNVAADIVGAHCSVLDNSMVCLAISDGAPAQVIGVGEHRRHALSQHAMEVLQGKGLVAPKSSLGLTVFDWVGTDGRTYTTHHALILERGVVIGSVGFISEAGPLPASRQELIGYVAKILSVEMQRNGEFLMNKALAHARLLRQLVLGDCPEGPDEVRARFAYFGHELGRYLRVYLLDHSDDYLTYEQVVALTQRLQPFVGNSIYLVADSDVVFLGSSDEWGASPLDEEGVEVNLMGMSTRLGVSAPFTDPTLVQAHVEQARRAAALGRELDDGRKVYSYERFRIDDVIARADSRLTLRLACFEPLMRLIERDESEGSQLAITLYEHLRSPQNPGEAAARLFIHKNTLYYRLDKIREVMGCDFHDAETIARIQLTFHILRATDDTWRELLKEL